jgi:hypothetical protein
MHLDLPNVGKKIFVIIRSMPGPIFAYHDWFPVEFRQVFAKATCPKA